MSPISTWSRCYRRWVNLIAVIALLVGSLALPLAKPVAAESGYRISGTVTGPDGKTPLPNIEVDAGGLFESSGSTSGSGATTAADGTYSLTVPADAYNLEFIDPSHSYATGGYDLGAGGNFTPYPFDCTAVTVGPDATHIDVSMPLGHKISGTVTGPDGTTPLRNIEVNSGPGSTWGIFGTGTAADGSYVLTVVPGIYTVAFYGSGNYIGGCYSSSSSGNFTLNNNACSTVNATMSDATNIDVSMPLGYRISGIVTSLDGKPLANIWVSVNMGNFDSGNWSVADGTYSFAVLPGTYIVMVSGNAGAQVSEYVTGCYDLGASGNFTTNDNACTRVTVGTSDVPLPNIAVPKGATYHPLTPTRLLDTRSGNGLPGRILANTPATFSVGGRGGVPANAMAVTGNLTVTGPSAGWAVYLGPDPISSPASSTLNFSAGNTVANGLTVALSASGSLSATYMSTAGNTTDLVFDVTGYFTPDTSGATYHPIAPARLLDTRSGNGLTAALSANTPATFQISGRAGIPANATAVTGNLTVVDETSAWAVFLGPDPNPSPTSSTINFTTGDILANGLDVALSSSGTLSATYVSTAGNTTDLVFDVTGYFTPDASGARYVAVTPARLLDTRSGNGLSGKLAANTPATFAVSGRGGVPANAAAVTGNVTVVNETNAWAVFLGPSPIPSPTSSTINFLAGDIRANGLTVALGSGGTLSATYMSTAGNTTDLVFDVTGYFVP